MYGPAIQFLSPDTSGAYQLNIKTYYGAKCDAVVSRGGGAITSGQTAFTHSSAAFTSADVGKLFYIVGAGVGGLLLSTTIAAYVSATAVVLADAASTTVTSAHYLYGTDDTAAWTAAAAAIADNAICTIIMPYALSLTGPVALKNNTSIIGMQSDGWAFRNTRRCSGLVLKPQSNGPAQLYGTSSSVGNVNLNKLMLDGTARFQGNTITKYSGGSIAAGSNSFTDMSASFSSADLGKKIAIYGAGHGGSLQEAAYVGTIRTISSSTTVLIDTVDHPATTTVSNGAYSYGFSTQQGLDGATTAASTTFSSTTANFTSADVGKTIEIYGSLLPLWGDGSVNHGDGLGEILSATIVARLSATSVTLSTAATVTASSLQWRIGVVHGIYQEHSTTSQDSMWHIENVVCEYFSGNGYTLGGLQRAQRFNKFYVWQCLGRGMHIESSDNAFFQGMTAECGEDGLYINQSTNHFINFDTFNNCGNGVYMSSYGQMCTFISVSVDNNEQNGMVAFGPGTMGLGVRFTSNSQCGNGLYSDYTCARKVASGVSNINYSGLQLMGCYWVLNGNGNKPKYGIENSGPYGIRGTGIQYDPTTSPWSSASVNSGTATSIHQTSMKVEGGTSWNFSGNNFFSCAGAGGLQIGTASTDYLGFFGATAVQKQNLTGAKGGNAALASVITALANLGLVTDNTSA